MLLAGVGSITLEIHLLFLVWAYATPSLVSLRLSSVSEH
jgi:hypothetical protein